MRARSLDPLNLRCFEEIQADMGLSLMMALVPCDHLKYAPQIPAALRKGIRDPFQIGIAKTGCSRDQSLACAIERFANRFDRTDIVVRCTPPFESADQITESGNRFFESLGRKQLFGDRNVHQLPSDVGSTRSWAPPERGVRIWLLGNFIEGHQCTCAIEFPLRNKELNFGHDQTLYVEDRLKGCVLINRVTEARQFASRRDSRRCDSKTELSSDFPSRSALAILQCDPDRIQSVADGIRGCKVSFEAGFGSQLDEQLHQPLDQL